MTLEATNSTLYSHEVLLLADIGALHDHIEKGMVNKTHSSTEGVYKFHAFVDEQLPKLASNQSALMAIAANLVSDVGPQSTRNFKSIWVFGKREFWKYLLKEVLTMITDIDFTQDPKFATFMREIGDMQTISERMESALSKI